MVVPSNGHRKTRLQRDRSRWWIVCAVLAVSLWRGPVPWIHVHETLAPEGVIETLLAWHLQHFHPAGQKAYGWHVHWTLPWEIDNWPSEEKDPELPSPTWVYEMPFASQGPCTVGVDQHANSSPCPALLLLDQDSLEALDLDATSVCSLHFLQTYSPSVALRALICVARC